MISTRQLAELAGVSQSTVSRSLNDNPGISVETRERIQALAKQHGYVERRRSRKTVLSSRRSAIGVLFQSHNIHDDIFIKYLSCVLYSSIEQHNYNAIPLMDIKGQAGVGRLRDLIRLGFVEGFIIVNRWFDSEIDHFLSGSGIPYTYLIFIGRNSSELVNVVDTDNLIGGYIATKHLLGLGHRRIATITTPWVEYEDRTAGYAKALMEQGLEVSGARILRAEDCKYDDGYRMVCENLATFREATALFAQNDTLALGAMTALQDNGVRVPEDFSVIGYDGIDIGRYARPQLTSVVQPIEELARSSVEKLLEMRLSPSRRDIQTKTFIHPKLLERQSTAPPKGE